MTIERGSGEQYFIRFNNEKGAENYFDYMNDYIRDMNSYGYIMDKEKDDALIILTALSTSLDEFYKATDGHELRGMLNEKDFMHFMAILNIAAVRSKMESKGL